MLIPNTGVRVRKTTREARRTLHEFGREMTRDWPFLPCLHSRRPINVQQSDSACLNRISRVLIPTGTVPIRVTHLLSLINTNPLPFLHLLRDRVRRIEVRLQRLKKRLNGRTPMRHQEAKKKEWISLSQRQGLRVIIGGRLLRGSLERFWWIIWGGEWRRGSRVCGGMYCRYLQLPVCVVVVLNST